MNSKYWTYLFFADLLAEITAIATGWNNIQLFTKPLLVIFLFGWFMVSSAKFLPMRYCIAAALFFSWMGDVFLMMEKNGAGWFIAGLASFLLAHVMYILFFLKVRRLQSNQKPWSFQLIAVVAVYALSLFLFLFPHIGSLQIPVAVYAITIATMLITATHAFNKLHANAADYCTTGAVLFLISDSLLAINKFYYPFAGAGVCIMLTYGLAQFAIIKGSLLYLAEKNKG